MDGASVEGAGELVEGSNPLGGLVPDSVKESPAYVVAGALGWFLYQHRGRLASIWRRIRGRR